MPTDLEKAAALRAAAEFCEDPRSPKCRGSLCNKGLPWEVSATRWCAIGYVFKCVGDQFQVPGCGNIAVAFDNGDYLRAARELRVVARYIEDGIPTTPEVAIPEEITV